jgi:GNAT superfamily N-acetyltransferase
MIPMGVTTLSDGPQPNSTLPATALLGGAGDAIAIDLLRHLDPERLILYGERYPVRDDWERHRRQRSEYVLVATDRCGAARRVVGTLEFRIVAGVTGESGLIDRLFVDARYRRRGIASQLLRAAIAFARQRGLAELRENIPNLLVRDLERGAWSPHLPSGEGWGGLRSLGATANACAREGQPCAITWTNRGVLGKRDTQQRERIDATLTLPLTPIALANTPRARVAASGAALRARLLGDLADAASVQSTARHQVVNQTMAASDRA